MGLNLSGNDEITASVFNMSSVGENILNGGAYGIEASVITTAVLGAAVMLLILFAVRPHKRYNHGGQTPQRDKENKKWKTSVVR